MKRQRNMGPNCEGHDHHQDVKVGTTSSKKKKRVQKVRAEEEEEEKRGGGGGEVVVEAAEIGREWEEWPWLSGVVDEQMSWGSTWLPYWDVEFMSESYNLLFGDVIWDYDIWDLKGIKEVPTNP